MAEFFTDVTQRIPYVGSDSDDPLAFHWYDSAAYQDILPLRTRNIDGSTLIVEGVAPHYDPARTAAVLRKRAG